LLETVDVDSLARIGFVDMVSLVVHHKADFSFVGATDKNILDREGSFFNDAGSGDLPGLLVDI